MKPNCNGYVQRSLEGRRVYEHREAAEAKLGRVLYSGECVHHIDGDKANNTSENILVFKSLADHARHHALESGGILEQLDDGAWVCYPGMNRNRICAHCKELFKLDRDKATQKYCSRKCVGEARTKPKETKERRLSAKPSKEVLEKLVWTVPTTKLAKVFNVSDIAITKWCKGYGISKPPRGYWRKQESNNK